MFYKLWLQQNNFSFCLFNLQIQKWFKSCCSSTRSSGTSSWNRPWPAENFFTCQKNRKAQKVSIAIKAKSFFRPFARPGPNPSTANLLFSVDLSKGPTWRLPQVFKTNQPFQNCFVSILLHVNIYYSVLCKSSLRFNF